MHCLGVQSCQKVHNIKDYPPSKFVINLLAGSNDGSVAIYDLEVFSQTPRETCSIIASVNRNSNRAHTSICSWIQWHVSDTGIFTTSSRDKTLKVWDTNNMKPVDKYQFDRAVFQHSLAPFCAKTSIIAVATACSNAYLVDLISGTKMQQLRGHKAGVICVQWSPTDPNVLATSGQDGQIIIWDIRSAKTQLTALGDNSSGSSASAAHSHAITGLKFTEDGFYLISLDTEGYTNLWSGRTMCRMRNFKTRKLTGNLVIRAVGLDFAYHISSPNETANIFEFCDM
uniref:Uncharacterized protein n=1 Tax=Romanomermis culicivorax TaxID=13658 RepID=A0A915KXQ8_ROMCU